MGEMAMRSSMESNDSNDSIFGISNSNDYENQKHGKTNSVASIILGVIAVSPIVALFGNLYLISVVAIFGTSIFGLVYAWKAAHCKFNISIPSLTIICWLFLLLFPAIGVLAVIDFDPGMLAGIFMVSLFITTAVSGIIQALQAQSHGLRSTTGKLLSSFNLSVYILIMILVTSGTGIFTISLPLLVGLVIALTGIIMFLSGPIYRFSKRNK